MNSGFFGAWPGLTPVVRRRVGLTIKPTLGAELLINGGFENGNPPESWEPYSVGNATLSTEDGSRPGSDGARVLRVTMPSSANTTASAKQVLPAIAAGTWVRLDGWGNNINCDVGVYLSFSGFTPAAFPAFAPSAAENAVVGWRRTYACTVRATGAAATFVPAIRDNQKRIGSAALFDDLSARPITLASTMLTENTPSADVDFSALTTWLYPVSAHGLVARVDSDTDPRNFIVAYMCVGSALARKIIIDKCVNGVYTNLYSANQPLTEPLKELRLACVGTSVALYFNGTQVGSTLTVADASIVDNTRHGLFSTHESNSFYQYSGV